jgi:hypothetical protein
MSAVKAHEGGTSGVSEDVPEGIPIPLTWIGAEDLPVHFINKFVGQVEAEEHVFYLTIGQALPPALVGTPEEKLEQLEAISYVPIKPIARLAFTRKKLEELIAVLQTNLDQYEEIIRRTEGGDET